MPIRFRCYFCRQLLAIAQRKAGTVITCPTCQGQVWVPDPNRPEEMQPGGQQAAGFGEIDVELVPAPQAPAGGNVPRLAPQRFRFLIGALLVFLLLLFALGIWIGRSFRK